jgi:hypothetical protein
VVVDEAAVAQAQGAVAFVEVVVAAGAQGDEVGQAGEAAEPPGDGVVGDGAGVGAAGDGAGGSPSGVQGASFSSVGHASGAAGADGVAGGVEQDSVELAVAAQALQRLRAQGGGPAVGQGELGWRGAEASFDGVEGGDDRQVGGCWFAGGGGGGVVQQVAQGVVPSAAGVDEAQWRVGSAVGVPEVVVGVPGAAGGAGLVAPGQRLQQPGPPVFRRSAPAAAGRSRRSSDAGKQPRYGRSTARRSSAASSSVSRAPMTA